MGAIRAQTMRGTSGLSHPDPGGPHTSLALKTFRAVFNKQTRIFFPPIRRILVPGFARTLIETFFPCWCTAFCDGQKFVPLAAAVARFAHSLFPTPIKKAVSLSACFQLEGHRQLKYSTTLEVRRARRIQVAQASRHLFVEYRISSGAATKRYNFDN